jgi:hypothetical protein
VNHRAFRKLDGWTERLVRAESMPYPMALDVERSIQLEVHLEGKEIEMLSDIDIISARCRRDELAKARLLKTALGYLITGKLPQLADPYGTGPLRSSHGDTLRIWSVNWDGVDHGGHGDWRGYWGQDLVLELPSAVR